MIQLSREDEKRLKNSAKVAQALENKWVRRFKETIAAYSARSADQISSGGAIVVPDFEKMLIEHYFDVQIKAITLAENEQELDKRLAKSARSIKEILKLYDRWRKGLYKPKGFQTKAASIKKEYVSAIQDTWKTHSEDFRNGGKQTQEEIKKKVAKSTGATEARANTIVRTETTRFYNETRKVYYDKAPNVTHYLFIAVRDKATTPWCRSATVNGYRGRSGLVYAKDDPLLEKEKPPCFTGETPILTLSGWKRIDTVIAGEYVFTHAKRWRRIKKIHNTPKKSGELFQIGFGMATANHPYFERGTGFVEAELFRTEKGIWSGSLNLLQVLKAGLDALVQKRPKVLFDTLSHYYSGSYSKKRERNELARWKENIKTRVHRGTLSRAPSSEQAGICSRTQNCDGKAFREISEAIRDCSSYQSDQNGQSFGKSSSYVFKRTHRASQKIRWVGSAEIVYNLEVEEDETYFAGGFLVHNCHWNCRSELLPLSRFNPTHQKMIADESIQRRNNTCTPLPPGWNK